MPFSLPIPELQNFQMCDRKLWPKLAPPSRLEKSGKSKMKELHLHLPLDFPFPSVCFHPFIWLISLFLIHLPLIVSDSFWNYLFAFADFNFSVVFTVFVSDDLVGEVNVHSNWLNFVFVIFWALFNFFFNFCIFIVVIFSVSWVWGVPPFQVVFFILFTIFFLLFTISTFIWPTVLLWTTCYVPDFIYFYLFLAVELNFFSLKVHFLMNLAKDFRLTR
jgi:hypothetical protein